MDNYYTIVNKETNKPVGLIPEYERHNFVNEFSDKLYIDLFLSDYGRYYGGILIFNNKERAENMIIELEGMYDVEYKIVGLKWSEL